MPRNKALRKSLRRKNINDRRKAKIKLRIREFLKAVRQKDLENAREKLNLVYKEIDKASKTFLHKNKAARLKSKYANLLSLLENKVA